MKKVSIRKALEDFGIRTEHSEMPNGEIRFRLIDASGRGYVRTLAASQGAWQKSHVHRALVETYIVQSGWIATATLAEYGRAAIRVLEAGAIWSSPVEVAHNVYMAADSETHVVKHGEGLPNDWSTIEETVILDRLTLNLDEAEILRLAGACRLG